MPRPDVSDIRREQILNAALSLFSEAGIEATSMSAIAEKCDLSKATIYHYFDNKETMVLSLLDNIFTHDEEAIDALKNPERPVIERLMSYTQAYAEVVITQPALFAVFFEFYSNAIRHDSMQKAIAHYFEHYAVIFKEIFQQGYDNGEFSKGSAQIAGETYIALIEGTVIMSFIRKTDLTKHIQESAQLFLLSLA